MKGGTYLVVGTNDLSHKTIDCHDHIDKVTPALLAVLRDPAPAKNAPAGDEEPTAMVFTDSTFYLPLSTRMKPLVALPQLVLANPPNAADVLFTPRLILLPGGSSLIDHMALGFRHAGSLMKNLLVRFPVKVSAVSGVADIFESVRASKQTWKSVIMVLASSIHIAPERLLLTFRTQKECRVLFPFQAVSDIFANSCDPHSGAYRRPGELWYEIAPERLSLGSARISLVDERFSDSDAGRKAFFNGLSNDMATLLIRLQDDLIEQLATTDLSDCLPRMLSRISKEFIFDSNDSLQVVGVKYVVSSVLVSLLAPYVFALFQKSFFLLKAWSAFHTWISQESRFWKQVDLRGDETMSTLSKCIVTFLLGQPGLVESMVTLPHDVHRVLRYGGTAKVQGIFGYVLMVIPVVFG
jgi:hypothetical protein